MRTDVWDQAVGKTKQTVTNRQAYDVVYPNHKAYYEDKKWFVFDKNYKQMEKALVNTFEEAVDNSLKNPNLKDVDDIKEKKISVKFDKIPQVI